MVGVRWPSAKVRKVLRAAKDVGKGVGPAPSWRAYGGSEDGRKEGYELCRDL